MAKRTCLYGLILVLSLVFGALPVRADDREASPPGPTQANELNILFTGRLLGYFRLPSLQSGTPDLSKHPCPDGAQDSDISYEGQQLLDAVRGYEYEKRLFIGSGDNFALYLPSRIFAPAPDARGQYAKDQFRWDPRQGKWVHEPSVDLLADLRKRGAVVPTDNVGCFLAYAGYDAIVPGKEDFYFGAERLQALARFLASVPKDTGAGPYHPVQMLAANLLIKTSWVSDHDPIPDSKKPRLEFAISDSSKKPNISFPADGTEILPWLAEIRGNIDSPAVTITVTGPEDNPDVPDWEKLDEHNPAVKPVQILISNKRHKNEPTSAQMRCWALSGASNFQVSNCQSLEPLNQQASTHESATAKESAPSEGSTEAHWQLPLRHLEIGHYKACIWTVEGKGRPICSRFKVGVPLFQSANPDLLSKFKQKDPSPYLVKGICSHVVNSKCEGEQSDVAVFGVVDTTLEEKIGSLESIWRTVEGDNKYLKKYDTSLEVVDPAKSLTQLVDYLEACGARGKEDESTGKSEGGGDECYGAALNHTENGRKFRKILLAQMDGGEAGLLAAHLTGQYHFDAVVSEYDPQQFTRNQISVMDPTLSLASDSSSKSDPVLDCDRDQCNLPSFVAVPPPAWDPTWSGDPTAKDPTKKDSRRIGDPVRLLRISDRGTQRQYVVSGARAGARGTAICNDCVGEPARKALADVRRQIAQEFKLSATAESTLRNWAAALLPQPPPPVDKAETVLQHATLYAMLQETQADVALMQKRDFYLPIPLADCLLNQLSPGSSFPEYCRPEMKTPPFVGDYAWQKILDAFIWKGDLLIVIPVRGSVLQAVMKRSRQFDANDDSSLSLTKEYHRGLVTLGIKPDGYKDAYLINDLPLDPNRVYAVATTDYIALGDTGYPDLVDAALPGLPRPLYDKRKLHSVSSLVCNELKKLPAGNSIECAPDFTGKGYFDELEVAGPAPLPGNTWQEGWKNWFLWRRLGQGPNVSKFEDWAQEQPTWRLSLDKTSIGFNVQRHSDKQSVLNKTFGGVSNSQATASRSHSWNTDQEMSYTYNHSLWDFVATEGLLYNASFTDNKSGLFRNANQSTDSFTLSAGPRFHIPGQRKLPHWGIGTYLHYDTQAFALEQSLSLTKNQIDVPTPLQFFLPRVHTLTDRIGIGRYNQNRYFEAGVEGGRAFGAFQRFDFFTNGVLVLQCTPSATQSLQKCVSQLGDAIVTPASSVQTLQSSRFRTGVYWHSMLNFPAGKRMSASLENQGEFYFNNAGDNSTDTRLQHLVTAKYSFQVWPSLSFSPTYQIFLYENKQAYKSLWQQQAGITIDFKFDWTSRRIAASQLQYRAAPAK